MAEEVKLFKTWSSRFGLRAVWALKLKGIEYEAIDEDLANKSPQLLQYNPVHKKVPVLVHNGKPIAESLVIVEYIDETWKQNPILPQDPYERATARFWAKFGDEKVLPSIWGVFTQEGKAQEELLGQAMENLKLLEEQLEGKVFFGGEKIGLADIALGWLANLICVLEEVSGLELITQEKFPLLFGWMQNFAAIPMIKESFPPHDKMITKYIALGEKYCPPVKGCIEELCEYQTP
ncbi:Glutathione S-transferase, C-terminal [Dillenia turbinata]|uniref:glutathione transferase n=1 Tax=Dillenia turbinata TaxID=194707 RepID=A0AAN8USJ5_9MAGN